MEKKKKIIQNGSCECSESELNVLSVPLTMAAMQESQWIEHFPMASLANNAPKEFTIPPQMEHWTGSSQLYLYVKFKIIKADSNNLDVGSNLAPVNNFLHSMFRSVDLDLNNKLISSNSDTYPYRAYIENLLSYNHTDQREPRTPDVLETPNFSRKKRRWCKYFHFLWT